MNADELLVKRKRGSKRFVIGAAVIGGLFFLVGILIGYFSHKGDSPYRPDPQPEILNVSKYILDHVNTSYLQSKLRDFAAQPRLAGTEGSTALAQKIHSLWTASGLDDVHITSYNVLLSFPNDSAPNKVELVNKTSSNVLFISSAYEPALLPAENKSASVMNYNAYSPAGIASGDLVYVNYGTIEDFEYLTKNLSLNLTGLIVIARYGKIFRGNKVYNAERYNASAVILYADPADVNKDFNETGKDKPYPDSWWMPSKGVQRGTLYVGGEDPDTPLYPATDYAVHIDASKRVLPKIPCQPISYDDAKYIMCNLSWRDSPLSWHGTLPIDYKIGPGYENTDLKIEVTVNNYLDTRPVHQVIGILRGREEPDRYVLLGNHHDAWVYGAVEPQSGGVALSNVVDIFGHLRKLDYRPRRTLVFCSWDAEEPGVIGSSEWVKDNLKVLYERSVAYINVDMSVDGNYTLKALVSPLLQDALYDAAKQVPSPISEYKTLYELWLDRSPFKDDGLKHDEPRVSYSLGQHSDYAKFYQLAGIPSTDIQMYYDLKKYPIPTYPLYHSRYDNAFFYETHQDPGFVYTKVLTQFWAILANNIADLPVLPLSVKRYSTAISKFINDLLNAYTEVWKKNHVNIDGLISAVKNFTTAAEQFDILLSSERKDLDEKPYRLRMFNDKMMQLERAFINPEGLPDRPQMKHIIFAPSTFDSYTDTFFPGISDAMHNISKGIDQWDSLKQQVYITTFFIQSAARSLSDVGL